MTLVSVSSLYDAAESVNLASGILGYQEADRRPPAWRVLRFTDSRSNQRSPGSGPPSKRSARMGWWLRP